MAPARRRLVCPRDRRDRPRRSPRAPVSGVWLGAAMGHRLALLAARLPARRADPRTPGPDEPPHLGMATRRLARERGGPRAPVSFADRVSLDAERLLAPRVRVAPRGDPAPRDRARTSLLRAPRPLQLLA